MREARTALGANRNITESPGVVGHGQFVVLQYYIGLANHLEYKSREGKPTLAYGVAADAITVRWKEIKERVFDHVSQAKLAEDLAMERHALFLEEESKKRWVRRER